MKIRYLTAGQNPVLPCGTAPMFYLRPLAFIGEKGKNRQ